MSTPRAPSAPETAAAGPSGPAASTLAGAGGAPDQPGLTAAGSDHGRRETLSLMASRVGEAYLRQPLIVPGDTDVLSLCQQMAAQDASEALVRDGDRLGVFTTTNLRDVVLMDRAPASLRVAEVASFPTVEVAIDDDLFTAMILMLRHRVHRVVVRGTDGGIAGVLSQLDLMSFVANHSHLIAMQAADATDVAALRRAADQIEPLIRVLASDGVRVEVIAGLVGELNRAVFRRLWELVAPETLRARSCLIVMGSEGRGEQIIRTDQDNGLILADDADPAEAAAATEAFTAALVGFGYPPCPGGIMANQPLWRQTVTGFRQTFGRWIYDEPTEGMGEGPMNLAIFMDALAVAGDARLLDEAKAALVALMTDSDAYLARFAAAVYSFSEDRSWWSRLPGVRGRASAEIDLKKLGLFPIVQGVRALALKYRVPALATTERLAALVAAGRVPEGMARDLTDALHFLMGAKLETNLRQIAAGRPPGNLVSLDELGTLDRQALKDSLAIVRGFRDWVSQQFRLPG
ncbi:CBS domain-containing protein [Paracoccus sanguinis]|uniref:CBS domain-containing protein n=1 Tax=Paracoccus sanguinis TaxID=1545044 RepID=A0A1H2ZIP2_9RHOB|nr:CBS domain-containing protein [Paracoccus sanguinis]